MTNAKGWYATRLDRLQAPHYVVLGGLRFIERAWLARQFGITHHKLSFYEMLRWHGADELYVNGHSWFEQTDIITALVRYMRRDLSIPKEQALEWSRVAGFHNAYLRKNEILAVLSNYGWPLRRARRDYRIERWHNKKHLKLGNNPPTSRRKVAEAGQVANKVRKGRPPKTDAKLSPKRKQSVKASTD